MSSTEMNIIWKKDTLKKFSKESLSSQKLASGDSAKLQCRLCGASDQLQLITNNRVDETLRLYFGVQVPPEGAICQSCLKCMKITEGFSALVHASFDKTISQESLTHSKNLDTISAGVTDMPKNILSLLNTKIILEKPKKKREPRKSLTKTNSKLVFRKIIVACTVCAQKYPTLMHPENAKTFVCSRCLKQNANRKSKANYTLSRSDKIVLEASRLKSLPKKPQPVKPNNRALRYDNLGKNNCIQFPKKYAIAENLKPHLKPVHEVKSNNCVCSVCGVHLISKEHLEKHMAEHKDLKNLQCTNCQRLFRCNRALRVHRISHEKPKIKPSSST